MLVSAFTHTAKNPDISQYWWIKSTSSERINQFIIRELSTGILVKLVGENARLWESIESHPMAREFIGRLWCDEWCSSVGISFTGNSYFLPLQETDFHLLRNVHQPMQSIWTGFTMNALFSEESSHHWIKTNSKLYYFILNLYLVFECCWCSLFKCNVICLYVLRFKAQNGLAFLVLWFRQGSVSLGSAPLHR